MSFRSSRWNRKLSRTCASNMRDNGSNTREASPDILQKMSECPCYCNLTESKAVVDPQPPYITLPVHSSSGLASGTAEGSWLVT